MTSSVESIPIADLNCKDAMTIFCGVFDYNSNFLDSASRNGLDGFNTWKFHINSDKIKNDDIIDLFKNVYYGSFIKTIFNQEDIKKKIKRNKRNTEITRFTKEINNIYLIEGKTTIKKEVKVLYLDLFVFPKNIAIYSFKCDFSGCTYDELSFLNDYIRDNALSIFPFINELLLQLKNTKDSGFHDYGNKLKLFTTVELEQDLSPQQEKELLYDLATCSPVGSASGQVTRMQPSMDYFNSLLTNNGLNIFDNWKGLCLLDSFTVIFRRGCLNNFMWENGYFNLIFLHSIYVKYFLFRMNKRFYLEKTARQKLVDEFYEFDLKFNLDKISYNFLPQIIYDKTRNGFNINNELSRLKSNIENAYNTEKSRRDKSINEVLTIIAIFTVFSIMWDVTEWINKLSANVHESYNLISLGVSVSILVLISFYFIKNYLRNRKK